MNFDFEIFEHQFYDFEEHEQRSADCARLMEFRNVIGESFKIISVNLMFRFFFVVHAEKGLFIKETSNSHLIQAIYVRLTFGSAGLSQVTCLGLGRLCSRTITQTTQSRVKGRICLNHRLDWDHNKRSKETSDIYVKPRLVVKDFALQTGVMLALAEDTGEMF